MLAHHGSRCPPNVLATGAASFKRLLGSARNNITRALAPPVMPLLAAGEGPASCQWRKRRTGARRLESKAEDGTAVRMLERTVYPPLSRMRQQLPTRNPDLSAEHQPPRWRRQCRGVGSGPTAR